METTILNHSTRLLITMIPDKDLLLGKIAKAQNQTRNSITDAGES